MPTFFVDSDRTEQSSTFMQNKYDEALELLAQVKADVDALCAEGYKTEASERDFRPFVDQFNQSYTGVSEGLRGISQYVKGVGDAFTQTDESLGQSLRG